MHAQQFRTLGHQFLVRQSAAVEVRAPQFVVDPEVGGIVLVDQQDLAVGVPRVVFRQRRRPRVEELQHAGRRSADRLSFGSDSEAGARFTAMMYSTVGTLALNGVDVLRWLTAWLAACADNGGCAPDDLSPWLPWSMDAERRNESMAPG